MSDWIIQTGDWREIEPPLGIDLVLAAVEAGMRYCGIEIDPLFAACGRRRLTLLANKPRQGQLVNFPM